MSLQMMYRDALNLALKEEMRRDPSVFCMGVGIAERGGSYKVTVGLLEEFGKKRVIDTPISEASFTGAGVGAAIAGMRPVVEILFVDFTLLVLDQLVNQAAKYSFMTGGKGKVPLVLRTQGGVEINITNHAAVRTPDSFPSLQKVLQHISWAPVVVNLKWEAGPARP